MADRPSDEEFRTYFERVLNPPDFVPPPDDVSTNVSILVLHGLISTAEVECQIKKMNVDKACGTYGLPPGVLIMLPFHWVLTLTTLFSTVFMSGAYLVSWVRAKVVRMFKRRRDGCQ